MIKKYKTTLIVGLGIMFIFGGLILATVVLSQDSTQGEAVPTTMKTEAMQAGSTLFNYQGRLLDNSGQPLNSSGISMVFEIFPVSSGGTNCWKEIYSGGSAIKVQDGIFQVMLGQITPISAPCATGEAYLQLTVNGEVMAPRERLTAVATALQAATADSAIIASTAASLTDGATAEGTLNMKGNIIAAPGNSNLYIQQPAGNSNLRFSAGGNIHMFIDSDNSSTSNIFTLSTNSNSLNPPIKHLLIVEESGKTTINGNLNLNGSCSQAAYGVDDLSAKESCSGGNLTTAAVIEANLQTADELSSERIERFSEGDVLCWAGEQLEQCDQENDRLVQAVASHDGKPIIIGAEKILVLGPVEMGDILVSSSTPGYAMVNNEPAPGTVIAQALEDLEDESGLIKAMIRKW